MPCTPDRAFGFATEAIHAGQRRCRDGAPAMPVYQTTSYVFDDTSHAAALFNLRRFAQHLHTYQGSVKRLRWSRVWFG